MDPIIIESLDPGCTFITPLDDGSRCIGDDREVINDNFVNLDTLLCNLSLSADEHWDPMYTVVAQYSAGLITAHDTVKELSAFWDSAATTVQEMSASWISPITIIYPEPFTAPSDISTITAWAQETFTVLDDTTSSCPRIRYPEGQRLWIVSLEYASTMRNIQDQQTGSGVCALSDTSINVSVWGIRFKNKSTAAFNLSPSDPTKIGKVHGHVNVEATLVNHKLTSVNDSVVFSGGLSDQYVGAAMGIELMVVGGEWVYTGVLPGRDV